jgi:hypothetical protein
MKKCYSEVKWPHWSNARANAGRFSPWEGVVDGFVARQNIEHYREMLKSTTDPAQRRLIEKLLLEQEAKLKEYEENHKQELPPTRRQGDGPTLPRGDRAVFRPKYKKALISLKDKWREDWHFQTRLLKSLKAMSYRISFFKNLCSSDGHQTRYWQQSIVIRRAKSVERAVEAAKLRFKRLYHTTDWSLHADGIELEMDLRSRVH